MAAVVIGRNEGANLRRCLESVLAQGARTVYVDSGSADDSVAIAQRAGAAIVVLDEPYTAGRARNAGAAEALREDAGCIQFVDGDCELAAGWLARAQAEMEKRPEVAVVCGRRRERAPDASVYNLLCDVEWNTPVGEAAACGGDAMVRVSAWREAGGFDGSLIAGEEPEFCLRLRRRGWKILRVDAEMTLHDARMMRFGQWWRRTERSGYAFAEGAWRNGRRAEPRWARESASIWAWGVALPALIAAAAWWTGAAALALLLLYPLLTARIYKRTSARGYNPGRAAIYAVFCVLGKLPQAIGQIRFLWRTALGGQARILEYKAGKSG